MHFARLEFGHDAEVGQQAGDVLRFIDGCMRVLVSAGAPRIGILAPTCDMALQHSQRDHHVVCGVCDEVAKRLLAVRELLHLGADSAPRSVEGARQLGDLVVARIGDRRFIERVGTGLDVAAELAQSLDERAPPQTTPRRPSEVPRDRHRRSGRAHSSCAPAWGVGPTRRRTGSRSKACAGGPAGRAGVLVVQGAAAVSAPARNSATSPAGRVGGPRVLGEEVIRIGKELRSRVGDHPWRGRWLVVGRIPPGCSRPGRVSAGTPRWGASAASIARSAAGAAARALIVTKPRIPGCVLIMGARPPARWWSTTAARASGGVHFEAIRIALTTLTPTGAHVALRKLGELGVELPAFQLRAKPEQARDHGERRKGHGERESLAQAHVSPVSKR